MAYIDKEKALEICENHYEHCLEMHDYCGDTTADNIKEDIEKLPTADVVEVKHGEWLDNYEKITTLGGNGVPKEYLCGYKCSLCGRTEIGKEPYCNCGAKMDGRRDT